MQQVPRSLSHALLLTAERSHLARRRFLGQRPAYESASSEEFRHIWHTRPVHAPGHHTKTIQHPEAGTLRLNCDVLLVPEDDQEVVLITADAGSPSARALGRLMVR